MKQAKDKRLGLVHVLFSRTLHIYFLLCRGLTLGVRAIVQSKDGQFLLVRHTYTPGWYFPGGGVEKGQTSEQALGDELRQETGLQLATKPVIHGVFYNDGVSRRDHVIVYCCRVRGSITIKSMSPEIAEIGFFAEENLPPDTDPGTVRRIHEVLGRVEKSDTW